MKRSMIFFIKRVYAPLEVTTLLGRLSSLLKKVTLKSKQ